jgi:FAD binding domain
MVSEDRFDAIVVGAGMAGLCCAGELVLQGARTLLISETREVGAALAAPVIDGNIGLMQIPTHQVGWGGGWWVPLARRLNVPIRAPLGFNSLAYDLLFEGQRQVNVLPRSMVSAADLVDAICTAMPAAAGARENLDRVLHAGFAIDYEALAEMDDVLLLEWLADQGADELTTMTIMTLASGGVATTGAFSREHVSVHGGIGVIRTLFSSEACYGHVYPDNRRGVAIPFAAAIERRGGTIWRGARVEQVEVSSGRVGQVVVRDGRTASAPMVALACTNTRIAGVLDAVPPEVEPALVFSHRTLQKDYHAFALLDREVLPADGNLLRGVLRPDGTLALWAIACHAVPWAMAADTQAKQFVVAGCCLPAHEDHGNEEEIFARLNAIMEFNDPGYKAATIKTHNLAHKPGHLWFENQLVGPKLPRRSDSVEGLWFVSQASRPTYGFYMEAGASAGILGARGMLAEQRRGTAVLT